MSRHSQTQGRHRPQSLGMGQNQGQAGGMSNAMLLEQLQLQNQAAGMFLPPTQVAGLFSGLKKDTAGLRGELAVRQARISYLEGEALYGEGSWERYGANRGPLLTPMNKSNGASGKEGYEWCGMFVGHAHAKAGIRPEILKANVFWSGHRLHLFFMKGIDINKRKIGDFWQPHKTLSLHGLTGDNRKKALSGFRPRAGDVAMFHSDYSHVGIVDSYDSKTGELMILEGNSGNRVRATTYAKGEKNITFIGRFNSSDYGPSVDESLYKQGTPKVEHDDKKSGRTR